MIIKNDIFNVDQITAIIFDIDGTVTRYNASHAHLKHVISLFNVKYEDIYVPQIMSSLDSAIEFSKDNSFLTLDIMYKSFDKFAPFLQEINVSAKSFVDKMLESECDFVNIHPSTPELLENLQNRNIRALCLTNWFYVTANMKLKNTGVRKYFSKIYTCETRHAKPNPASFISVLEEENLRPENVLMIGDSLGDLLSVNVGIQSVLIDYTGEKGGELTEVASAVVTHPMDIIELLSI